MQHAWVGLGCTDARFEEICEPLMSYDELRSKGLFTLSSSLSQRHKHQQDQGAIIAIMEKDLLC